MQFTDVDIDSLTLQILIQIDLTSDRSSYRSLVEKLSYRFHLPQQNDLVVFKAPPELEAHNLRDDLIKRVVGLPGDLVQIHNGQTLINGKAIAELDAKENQLTTMGL